MPLARSEPRDGTSSGACGGCSQGWPRWRRTLLARRFPQGASRRPPRLMPNLGRVPASPRTVGRRRKAWHPRRRCPGCRIWPAVRRLSRRRGMGGTSQATASRWRIAGRGEGRVLCVGRPTDLWWRVSGYPLATADVGWRRGRGKPRVRTWGRACTWGTPSGASHWATDTTGTAWGDCSRRVPAPGRR